MINANNLFEQVTQQASELLRNAPGKEEASKKVQALLSGLLSKMDVVSREEFDAQTAVLARSREKIDQLERQLEQLSQQIK